MEEKDNPNEHLLENNEMVEEPKSLELNKVQIDQKKSKREEEQNKELKNKEQNNYNENDSLPKGGIGINMNPENSGRHRDKEEKKEEEKPIKKKLDETIGIINDYKSAIKVFDGTAIKPLMNQSYKLVQYQKNLEKKQKELQEEIEKEKNSIVEAILNIRDNYIEAKSGGDFKSCINFYDIPTICLIFLSFFHFLYMMEIHGILFALFQEIKRDALVKIKYEEYKKKTFDDYFSTSSINDSSKINLNYIFSFLSDIFISRSSLTKIYIVSAILNIIISSLLLLTFNFLSIEEVEKGYSSSELIILCLSYCLIYIIASLISLYPISIILKLQKNKYWGVTFITFFLTLAVIIKNFLLECNKYNEHKYSHILIMFGGCLIFMIFFCLYRKRINSFYLNEDENTKSNEKKDEIGDKKGEKKDKNNSIEINIIQVENNQEEDNAKKEHRYEADYILGYLIIKDDFTKVIIKIRGFWGYLCSILNYKTVYIFFINFCSRAQKLKFKADYNKKFNQETKLLQLNFGLSYALYLIFLLTFFFYNKCCSKNSEKGINKKKEISDDITRREKFILILILLENCIILIFSIINFSEEFKWISYFSIVISGSFNFLLYDYFSFFNTTR